MGAGNEHRRALIIKDESSIGNILYVLLAGLGWKVDDACSARQGQAMNRRREIRDLCLPLTLSAGAELVIWKSAAVGSQGSMELQPSTLGLSTRMNATPYSTKPSSGRSWARTIRAETKMFTPVGE
jgi:hypothetical protein